MNDGVSHGNPVCGESHKINPRPRETEDRTVDELLKAWRAAGVKFAATGDGADMIATGDALGLALVKWRR